MGAFVIGSQLVQPSMAQVGEQAKEKVGGALQNLTSGANQTGNRTGEGLQQLGNRTGEGLENLAEKAQSILPGQ